MCDLDNQGIISENPKIRLPCAISLQLEDILDLRERTYPVVVTVVKSLKDPNQMRDCCQHYQDMKQLM